ncbi:MAG: Murein hydrolase activator EnvC precursor [Bacteroidetes bacterium ADurb.BinA174]|nr:MAG: Murein hydrolase activator EnvC precursor [Bacteroidetes bacterium ADurb.BinA174]
MRKVLVIGLFSVFAATLFSQTQQIDKLQKQQKILQEEIRNTNRLFLDVKKQTTTIIQRINLINKQIASRKEMMRLQNQEIAALEKEQSRLELEIKRLNEELKQKQDSYAKAVRVMQTSRRRQNELFFVLSGKSLGESLRRMQYLRDYSKWRKTQAEEIKQQNIQLTARKDELAKAQADKQNALNALKAEQTKLQKEEKIRQSEMTEARGKQKELQKTLQDKQQQARKLDARIEKLIAEEVARQEREAEARRLAAEAERKRKAEETAARARGEAEAKRKTEELARPHKKETATTTKETAVKPAEPAVKQPEPKIESATDADERFNLSKNFVSNRGNLPMPVTGTASIVGSFGQRRHSEWNVTTNSNGIDIQAQQGANIRTVFEGEVSKVFSVPGYNTCVIVRHGDYYTFYGNIYDLFVKSGDKLKTGQSLGRIYTDPDTGVATMHFQLWQKTTKLNPVPWLKTAGN